MELIVAAVVGLGACLGVASFFRNAEPRRRSVRLPAPTRVRDVREGGVHAVHGTLAQLDAGLTGPLSGQPCLAYRIRIKRVEQRRWLLSEDRCAPFFIEDSSGRARVEPNGADVHFSGDRVWDIVTLADHPPLRELLTTRLGKSAVAALGDDALLYREYRIRTAITATVHARVGVELDPAPHATVGYRERSTRPVLHSSPEQPMTVVLG